jgi:hypothetical protein
MYAGEYDREREQKLPNSTSSNSLNNEHLNTTSPSTTLNSTASAQLLSSFYGLALENGTTQKKTDPKKK